MIRTKVETQELVSCTGCDRKNYTARPDGSFSGFDGDMILKVTVGPTDAKGNIRFGWVTNYCEDCAHKLVQEVSGHF